MVTNQVSSSMASEDTLKNALVHEFKRLMQEIHLLVNRVQSCEAENAALKQRIDTLERQLSHLKELDQLPEQRIREQQPNVGFDSVEPVPWG